MFNSIRVKKIEKGAPYKIYLDVDYYDDSELASDASSTDRDTLISKHRSDIIKLAHKYRKYL